MKILSIKSARAFGTLLLLSIALAACAKSGPMFEEMTAKVRSNSLDVVVLTDIASQYIPLNTPKHAVDILMSENGFVSGEKYMADEADEREIKSAYYVAYRRSISTLLLTSRDYAIAVGFNDQDIVDFVSSLAKANAI